MQNRTTMNFIKTTIKKTDFKQVEPMLGKYVVRVLATENEDGTVTCAECMIDHEPSKVEVKEIEKSANDYYLPMEKSAKVSSVTDYDKSSAVNTFSLNGQQMWLPLEERKSMRQSLIALKAQGIETFTYWNGLVPITMPVSQFEAIMNAVEVYALQCFNVTAQHKANVMALTTIEDVEAYDYTKGYPDKLEF